MMYEKFVVGRKYSIELTDGTVLSTEDESELDDLYDEWLENKCVEIYRKWKDIGNIVLASDYTISMDKDTIQNSTYFKFKDVNVDDVLYVFEYLDFYPACDNMDIPINSWLRVIYHDSGYGARFFDIEKHIDDSFEILKKCNNMELLINIS